MNKIFKRMSRYSCAGQLILATLVYFNVMAVLQIHKETSTTTAQAGDFITFTITFSDNPTVTSSYDVSDQISTALEVISAKTFVDNIEVDTEVLPNNRVQTVSFSRAMPFSGIMIITTKVTECGAADIFNRAGILRATPLPGSALGSNQVDIEILPTPIDVRIEGNQFLCKGDKLCLCAQPLLDGEPDNANPYSYLWTYRPNRASEPTFFADTQCIKIRRAHLSDAGFYEVTIRDCNQCPAHDEKFVFVQDCPHLKISKCPSIKSDGEVTYTITAQNTGAIAATDVNVTDTIPECLDIQLPVNAPDGWSASVIGNKLVFHADNFSQGTATFTFTGTIADAEKGCCLNNKVKITAEGVRSARDTNCFCFQAVTP